MQQLITVTENSTSIIPRAIVESKFSVSPNQLDIIAILLAEIGKDTDVDSNVVYKLDAKDFGNLKGFKENSNNAYTLLREKICGIPDKPNSLGMRHIGFEICFGNNHFKHINWFSSIEYNEGVATFTLTHEIKEALVELKYNDEYKVFAKLKYILPMKSQYSKRLYLMCREFISSGERFCDTDWDLFLEKLDIPKNYSYAKVKERVLDKAKDEVNEFSDIVIEYKITEKNVRGGKKPISISFKIYKKETDYIGLPAE